MAETKIDGRADRKRRSRRSNLPTVADVAREAGVSPMTVSRVINGMTNVVPETRDRVREAIAKLGYVPNNAARNLAGGKQCRIALLHSNPSSAYLSEFLMGALEEASASNAQLIVEYCEESDTAQALAKKLQAHRADGVLLPPPLCDDSALIDQLHGNGLALAQIATGAPSPLANAVMIDDRSAAHAIACVLTGLGHRRIGFIAGNPNQTASALRRAGYEAALADAGLALDDALVRQGDFSYRSGLVAADALLRLPDPPTAILACNDDMAAAAVATCHRRGLDVPQDVSICGFDDTAMATTIWPELTTVRQPIAEMARSATSLLVAAVRREPGNAAIEHRQIDFEVVRRDSEGKCDKAG